MILDTEFGKMWLERLKAEAQDATENDKEMSESTRKFYEQLGWLDKSSIAASTIALSDRIDSDFVVTSKTRVAHLRLLNRP